ncbi:MAG: hypothetical protein LBG08_08560 [Spirochaetaceae bacterium]|jgi:hypothetical protein|nr:hypothetical protein [Spirochaetaceae bacterium]
MISFWYGIIPAAGAFLNRRSWRNFRQRFNELRLKPFLDYSAYQTTTEAGGLFRFIGGFESTDGHTLWIRSTKLTVPVAIMGAQTYLLPMPKGEIVPDVLYPDEEAPERIRWDRVSTLTEGARVFVGGLLKPLDNRMTFVSTKENPLLVIFYDGPDRSLTNGVIRAGQYKNQYWNRLTPYGLILGAFSLIIMAFSFLSRPAFRLTAISALIALFIPLYPLLPPGMIFTFLYRRLGRQAGICRFCRELIRLPLFYFSPERETPARRGRGDPPPTGGNKPSSQTIRLPNGEPYGCVSRGSLPAANGAIPLIIPGERPRKGGDWYVFGSLGEDPEELPREPQDLFAPWGAIPGKPEILAREYNVKARLLEIASWLMLFAGLAVNVFFIGMVLFFLR